MNGPSKRSENFENLLRNIMKRKNLRNLLTYTLSKKNKHAMGIMKRNNVRKI